LSNATAGDREQNQTSTGATPADARATASDGGDVETTTDARLARRGARIALALALVGLIGFGALCVFGPGLIEQAAHGGASVPLLDRVLHLRGAPEARVLAAMGRALRFGAAGLLGCMLGATLVYALTRPRFVRGVVGRATPGALGATRALASFVLLLIMIQDDLGSAALLPREMREPMGMLAVIRKFPLANAVLESHTGLALIDWVTTAALVLALIGLFTRVALPIAAAGFFLYAGIVREYSWFTHQGLVPLYVLTALCFTPCGDGFSVDRLRRVWRGAPVPPRETATATYGWARYACIAVFAMQYVFAGASKLRNGGWDWWCAENLRQIMLTDTLSPMAHEWRWSLLLVKAPDAFFAAVGIAAVLFELAAGIVLVWPRARALVALSLIGIHFGIYLMQNVLFYDLMLLQLMLFDFTAIRRWIGQRLRGRLGAVRVRGGVSPRAREVLAGLDLFERLDLPGGDDAPGETRAGLAVERRGAVYHGGSAVPVIATALPLGLLLAPLSLMPQVEAWVARSLGAPGATPAPAPAPRPGPGLSSRLILAGVLGALVGVWTLQGEFYPLTSVQMYSRNRKDNGGAIHYNRVLAHYEGAGPERAYLNKAIGVFSEARYRRLLDMSLTPERRPVAARAFKTIASIMNRDAEPGRRVQRFEVQRRRWDYHASPDDPEHGQNVAQVFFDVSEGEDAVVSVPLAPSVAPPGGAAGQ
jgi:Vitamin K-dependent gamma-carboxylase